MKKFLTELIDSNYFFVSLLGFVFVLPLSEALVSVFAGVVFVTALIEDTSENKRNRIRSRRLLLMVPVIFFIYAVSSLLTLKYDHSFYDVQKVMFYLIFPLAFSLGKEVTQRQKRVVLYVFTAGVLIAIMAALVKWKLIPHTGNFSVHTISLISHIRFSFQLILVIWFLVFIGITNFRLSTRSHLALLFLLVLINLGYLAFQQSLTGIVAFVASGIYFLYYLFTFTKGEYKVSLAVGLLLLIIVPAIYVQQVVKTFYQFDMVDVETIDQFTAEGNPYSNDFGNRMVENGHFVGLYVCEDEMRREWNQVSEYKYDSMGLNGYPVYTTLVRYLTSKNLRKDAEGVKALKQKDIENIEQGMANVIFQKKCSLYPRIYQTVWEVYVYSQTGYSNHQSFSQRIEFAKAAITIIKKHPLLGVGTGKWKQEFALAFKENQSQLDQSLYASSHNQYLNYMVKFGLIGFVLIMFLIVYPVVKTKRYNDPLFMVMLVFMFFANFADSNLESHMGSSFFFFFYCFFITGPIDYLKIKSGSLFSVKV